MGEVEDGDKAAIATATKVIQPCDRVMNKAKKNPRTTSGDFFIYLTYT